MEDDPRINHQEAMGDNPAATLTKTKQMKRSSIRQKLEKRLMELAEEVEEVKLALNFLTPEREKMLDKYLK